MQLLKDRILTDGNVLTTVQSPRSLPSRLPVSVLPVLRHSISMYRLYLPRKHRV